MTSPEGIQLAKNRFSIAQLICLGWILVALIAIVLYFDRYQVTLIFGTAVTGLFIVYVLIRLTCISLGIHKRFSICFGDQQLAELDDAALPIYTILLPVFREPEVVQKLIQSIGTLDYPKSKLDVKLLVEGNDSTTRSKITTIQLPEWLNVMVVPEGFPQTKPRACNYGLAAAKGVYTVVFDAEDRPDPDQLKKAVLAFRGLPDTMVCLQAKLNSYNSDQNILTRLFTLEYMAWFDLYLPGLYAIGAVIPLGGTSNHFRTSCLKELRGWDPYNVTEDCDLGVRIALNNWETRILDSTTWEEAPSVLRYWFRQRTRWLKGYLQTFFVHSRQPLRLIKKIGLWKTFLAGIVIGGQVLTLSLLVPSWTLMGLWAYYRWPLTSPALAWTSLVFYGAMGLTLFNFVFVFVHLLAAYLRAKWRLAFWSVLFPFYWLLAGLAAWRGVFQFLLSPHHWEKTPHGLAIEDQPVGLASRPVSRHRLVENLLFSGSILFAILALKPMTEFLLDISPRNCYANIKVTTGAVSCRVPVNDSWLTKSGLAFEMRTPRLEPMGLNPPFIKVTVYLVVNEGQRFVRSLQIAWPNTTKTRIELPFDQSWKSSDWNSEMGPWILRDVKAVVVKISGFSRPAQPYLANASRGYFDVREVELRESTLDRSLRVSGVVAPTKIASGDRFEAKFDVLPYALDPFNREKIKVDLEIESPAGSTYKTSAFFTQDYEVAPPEPTGSKPQFEHLVAIGRPYWKARYVPPDIGTYFWKLTARDSRGQETQTARHAFRATAREAERPQASSFTIPWGQRYFRDRSGNFKYPLGMNLGWPEDDRSWPEWKLKRDRSQDETRPFDKIFTIMAENGMNFARVWMTPWWGSIEWNKNWPGYRGLGDYNLRNAWRIEHTLAAAEDAGIQVDLVLEPHGPFSQSWDSLWDHNPYNTHNGGFLKSPEDLFTDPRAIELFRRKYEYLISRFGTFKSLSTWEFWNEVTVVSPDLKAIASWHNKMADLFNKLDSFRRGLGTTVYWKPGVGDMWDLDSLSFVGIQGYNYGKGVVNSIESKLTTLGNPPKASLVTEFGGHPFGGPEAVLAHEIHDALWAAWVLPLAGAPLPWWWNLIVQKKIIHQYYNFSQYIAGEDLSRDEWSFASLNSSDARLKILARIGATRTFLWIYSPETDTYPLSPVAVDPDSVRQYLTRVFDNKKIPGFDPLKVQDPGVLFADRPSLTVNVARMPRGSYDVEVWDTWGRGRLHRFRFNNTTEFHTLSIPSIERDVAIKMRKR